MSKIAVKWQITPVITETIDNGCLLELAHNQDKKEWYITIRGEYYIEYTFDTEKEATEMYALVKKSTSLFMDSLLTVPSESKMNVNDFGDMLGTPVMGGNQ